ncbi:MAG: hypothetical protein LBD44_06190 [Spirochaetaceae bacterium]|jgi:hypothetical protein|nr:hypothetical protein [Spirochaetaceae bacterium]
MRKIVGLLCVVFTGLLVLLAGCPTEVATDDGEEYIAAAVLLNEKAKYNTAVALSLEESDTGTNVTDQFIRLLPGKIADRTVAVSVKDTGKKGYFILQDGNILFTGVMPPTVPEENAEKETESSGDGEETAEEESEVAGNDGSPNMEVITLRFRKGEESVTLEVLAIINRKGEEEQERIAATERNTFLLYGYDVINSAYINWDDVKQTRPILDRRKVEAANMIVDSTRATTLWEFKVGNTIKELFDKLNASISVDYDKGTLFSGRAETEFNADSGARYVKGRSLVIVRREYLRNTLPSGLKLLLDDSFVTEITTKSAADILDAYGTHLIADCQWGGQAEFNYSYTGMQLTTDAQIEAALKAATIDANASASAKADATELRDRSSRVTSSLRGGNTISYTVSQFPARYSDWVNNISSNPGLQEICGTPSFTNALIPIWTIANELNTTKAKQIETEFYRRVNERKAALESLSAVSGPSYATEYAYITALGAYATASRIPSMDGMNSIIRTNIYHSNAGTLLDTNLNRGRGGNKTFVFYNLEHNANKHEAIAEVRIVGWLVQRYAISADYQWWIRVPWILNGQTHGQFFALEYRKVNENDTMAIDFIGSINSNETSEYIPKDNELQPGYFWVPGYVSGPDYTGLVYQQRGDMEGISLTVRKVPFEW